LRPVAIEHLVGRKSPADPSANARSTRLGLTTE
jgi:hypothetical protein